MRAFILYLYFSFPVLPTEKGSKRPRLPTAYENFDRGLLLHFG